MSYTSEQVCRATGMTYRQLDYMCRRGIVFDVDTPGSGFRRQFSETEAMKLVIVGVLVDRGVMPTVAGKIAKRWEPGQQYAQSDDATVRIAVNTLHLRSLL